MYSPLLSNFRILINFHVSFLGSLLNFLNVDNASNFFKNYIQVLNYYIHSYKGDEIHIIMEWRKAYKCPCVLTPSPLQLLIVSYGKSSSKSACQPCILHKLYCFGQSWYACCQIIDIQCVKRLIMQVCQTPMPKHGLTMACITNSQAYLYYTHFHKLCG